VNLVRTITMSVRLADGFAMSSVRGTGAPAGWRHVQAAALAMTVDLPIETYAMAAGAATSPARNPQNQAAPLHAIAALPVVTPVVPVTTKQQLVATKGAGRGNKGSSPWRFPV
jgi:hypothetical protein